jgi:hypothetical protein
MTYTKFSRTYGTRSTMHGRKNFSTAFLINLVKINILVLTTIVSTCNVLGAGAGAGVVLLCSTKFSMVVLNLVL